MNIFFFHKLWMAYISYWGYKLWSQFYCDHCCGELWLYWRQKS